MTELWQQMVASCSGALITALFMTPLDVVKIRMQAQTKGFVKGQCFLYCNGLMDHVCTCLNGNGLVGSQGRLWKRLPNEQLSGMLDTFVKITRVEGIRTLWSGLPPTLVMALPNTVIYFTAYDQLRSALGYTDGKNSSVFIPFICGAAARAGAVTVITPLELVRTKIQSEQMTYNQVRGAVSASIRADGFRSLWRGWGPLMWRDVPFSALYFTFYEMLKSSAIKNSHSDRISFLQSFTFGGISGAVAGVITLPFDVVKTHRQIELGSTSQATNPSTAKTFSVLRSLHRQQGISSWFVGIGPRVLKVAPACAIMISSYEYCKRIFAEQRMQHSVI